MKEEASRSRDVEVLPGDFVGDHAVEDGVTVLNIGEVLLGCRQHRTDNDFWLFLVPRRHEGLWESG